MLFLEKNKSFFFDKKIHLVQLIIPSFFLVLPTIILFISLCFLIFYLYGLNFFFFKSSFFFFIILYFIPFCFFFWLLRLYKESLFLYFYNKFIKHNLILGFCLFLITEIIIFATFIGVLLEQTIMPSIFMGKIWPSFGIIVMNPILIPALNVLFLLISGFSANKVLRLIKLLNLIYFFNSLSLFFKLFFFFIINNFFFSFVNWVFIYRNITLTILFGFIFLLLQLVEFKFSLFFFSSGVFGTVFFSLLGLHGIHVFLGLGLWSILYFRFFSFHFDKKIFPNLFIYLTIFYWHCVDLIYILLYIFVYSTFF